jgi:hypothetical protein
VIGWPLSLITIVHIPRLYNRLYERLHYATGCRLAVGTIQHV